ncbi:AAA family ATPase [Aeromonas veronii]|uniref:AAA family ATPase n=1 Tax=Aeromonas veronii TaxID=654 RepID=UPI001F24D221|nr:AAA family ATPase [Aeromonas veronii]MCF5728703.1 AAA family ATPase [Aeromonas veronii]
MIDLLYSFNYKSFDELKLKVSNINILLGSNSCGKSSITNLLLMLSQTADTHNTYDNILRLNGNKSSLGEAINIFPDKKHDKDMRVGWSLSDSIIDKGTSAFKPYDLLNEVEVYCRHVAVSARRNDQIDIDIYHRSMRSLEKIFTKNFIDNDFSNDSLDIQGLKKRINDALKPILKLIDRKGDLSKKYNVELISLSRLWDLIDFHSEKTFLERKPKYVEYTIGYNSSRQECELKRLTILNTHKEVVIEFRVSKSKKVELYSDIISSKTLEISRLDIVRGIDIKNLTLIQDDFSLNCKNPFAKYVRAYTSSVLNLFSKNISGTKLNHVSPLRAFPQRYYLLEKSAQHNILNSNDGSQLAEILKNNPVILDKVNELFESFGIRVSTAKTNDIIHRITVKQNNVTVELTDVGFGISQVLPIIVQALLSPKDSLTIIEQPEIHLHPRMQAWLTNALVSISISDEKKFIIETHSDTVIKRLQMLLLDPNVNFSKEHLNIYHLERNKTGKTNIKNVPFNEIGEISWPIGFMDEEINDAILLQRLKVNKIKELKGKDNV